MATTNVRVVNGLSVKSATLASKNNQVKLVLEAEKDDIRAGTGSVADVLVSLEFHSTGADSSPVSVGLQAASFEFQVENFKVTQDKLVVVLATPEDEEGGDDDAANVNALILSAVAAHAANGTPVELTLAAANDVSGA
jgi:hypothetical protein